jgi:hypothetical protein
VITLEVTQEVRIKAIDYSAEARLTGGSKALARS